MTETEPTAEPAAAEPADPDEGRGKILLVVFWAWAALLLVAAVAQLLGLESVLDVLDVKRWFAR